MTKRKNKYDRPKFRGEIKRADTCDSPKVENKIPELETCLLVVQYLLGKTDGRICRDKCMYEEWRQAVRERSKL